MSGSLLVCGTNSNAGKSTLVAGLCRLLARNGVRVAPFKAQNMALNSMVVDGGEIGRAQWTQAIAAGVEPTVEMNPVLMKPQGDRTSQVIVRGKPIGVFSAVEYYERKGDLLGTVLEALDGLRDDYDVVVCEGAGSPTEINLLDHDIVNLRLAAAAGMPAIVVGDIDLGGVFASLFGTVELLPDELRRCVRAFVLNKFRGDPALLANATDQIEARCGVPTIGVVPHLGPLAIDGEDSLTLGTGWTSTGSLDVAVIAFPAISNVTDVDAIALEADASLRLVRDASALGEPDLIVLPGSKTTVRDLEWLRSHGLDTAIVAAAQRGVSVLGICGGYQILGETIDDDVESRAGIVDGLGLLPVKTVFETDKVTRVRRGAALGVAVSGYEIHHGRVHGSDEPVLIVDNVAGTTWHGAFESDAFRVAYLSEVAARRGKSFTPSGVAFADARAAQFDAVADAIEANVDLNALIGLIAEGARR